MALFGRFALIEMEPRLYLRVMMVQYKFIKVNEVFVD